MLIGTVEVSASSVPAVVMFWPTLFVLSDKKNLAPAIPTPSTMTIMATFFMNNPLGLNALFLGRVCFGIRTPTVLSVRVETIAYFYVFRTL